MRCGILLLHLLDGEEEGISLMGHTPADADFYYEAEADGIFQL